MSKDSRTLLEECIEDGKTSPLDDGCYSVIAARLVAYGGFECNRIEARIMDGHYLIVNLNPIRDFEMKPLAIVDMENKQEAEDRMYEAALKIATERARFDGNRLLNLTSRVEKPAEARHYESNRI